MYRLVYQGRLADHPPRIVREPVLRIGRAATCELPLPEAGVSDQHAAIERRPDGYYLCDLDSATGVRVNDQPVRQHRLSSGDEFEIGPVRLRFEVLHGIGTPRRAGDALQGVAVLIILGLIASQLAVLGWIFTKPRPAPARRAAPAGVATPPSDLPVPAPVPVAQPAVGSAPAPARPVVLTRMIRLERVQETVEKERLLLTVQARAQVGERTLDPRAVGLCVQFAVRGADDARSVWRYPFWLRIPAWDNFTARTFTVSFPGTTAEYGGYVVRSYYRGELQDVAAQPNSLLALTPDPMLK